MATAVEAGAAAVDGFDLSSILSEVDAAVAAAATVLAFVEKFDGFLPASLQGPIEELAKLLGGLQSILSKV